jgi:hypothetical protein
MRRRNRRAEQRVWHGNLSCPLTHMTRLPSVCRRARRNIQFWAVFFHLRTTHHSASHLPARPSGRLREHSPRSYPTWTDDLPVRLSLLLTQESPSWAERGRECHNGSVEQHSKASCKQRVAESSIAQEWRRSYKRRGA